MARTSWVERGRIENPFTTELGQRLEKSVATDGPTRNRLDEVRDAFDAGRFGKKRKAYTGYKNASMPSLVKGYGMTNPTNTPWGIRRPMADGTTANRLADYAGAVLEEIVRTGLWKPQKAMKGFYGPFRKSLTALNNMGPTAMAMRLNAQAMGGQWSKAFGLTTPLSSGFVPFDLVPFARTIYPVLLYLRNRIPRVPGQGTYHRAKIIGSITGSLPNGLGTLQDDSTSEFFGGAGFSAWPNPLPASGSQVAWDIVIPIKFYALTEAVTWLAQFAGQGFDDLYGLATLILMQEFMLLEEHDLLASSSQNLTAPTFTLTARSAGTGETGLSGLTTNVYAKVTAINFWGETEGTQVSVAATNGQVVDVFITTPSPGTLGYRIYTTTGTTPGTYYIWTSNLRLPDHVLGGTKFTLQGALPVTGVAPPVADTGTGASTRSESVLSVLSGLAYNGGDGPYPDVAAGYTNLNVGEPISVALVQNALLQAFNGPNGYFADPAELVTSPNDATILATSIQSESVAAYQLRVQQSEVANLQAGVAVANVINPVTRSAPEIVPHPYLPQGTLAGLSWKAPQTQNNLGNVHEVVAVQDVAEIGWPVVDSSFRASALRYTSYFCPAPVYNFLLAGLQSASGPPWE